MKLTRLNLVLITLTVALGAFVVLTRPAPPTAPPDEAAFPAFLPEAILEVHVGSPAGDEAAAPVVLRRASKDAPWTVDQRGGFPAEAFPIETLLGQLSGVRARDLISETAEGLALFGLASGSGVDVRLVSPGNADWRFVFADAAAGGQGFMRAAGDERVFVVQPFVGLSKEPVQWVQPGVFDLDVAEVRRLELSLAGTRLVVERDDKGIWREPLTGRVAPRVALEDLLADLDTLALEDVATHGADVALADEGLELSLFGVDDLPLAGLALDLTPSTTAGDGALRKLTANAWAGAWVGWIDEDAAALLMQRVGKVVVALEKRD